MPDSVRELATEFANKLDNITNYATFLNQPLNLGMFVPAIEVDGKWEVLDEPKNCVTNEDEKNICDSFCGNKLCDITYHEQYQLAKDRVLFEGFEVEEYKGTYTLIQVETTKYWTFTNFNDRFKSLGLETIEDYVKYAPTLTAKGQELSGLNK
jgi:hypothetical protein